MSLQSVAKKKDPLFVFFSQGVRCRNSSIYLSLQSFFRCLGRFEFCSMFPKIFVVGFLKSLVSRYLNSVSDVSWSSNAYFQQLTGTLNCWFSFLVIFFSRCQNVILHFDFFNDIGI